MGNAFTATPGTELKYSFYAFFAHRGQKWDDLETSCVSLRVFNPETASYISMISGTETWRSS
jgi:hypothetical protein